MFLQEVAGSVASPAIEADVHSLIVSFVTLLQEATEFLSVALIGIGIMVTTYRIVRLFLTSRHRTVRETHQVYQSARLTLSRFLAIALEFQLAADLLGTTVAPSWDQLGRLGAIAAIRTFLNFFLAREITEEEAAEREAREALPAK